MTADWWQRLRELDHATHLEYPEDYDQLEAGARFERLIRGLEQRFQCQCQVDQNVQDASFHGDIVVPAERTASGQQIWIRISNFGGLAVYSPERLGSHTDAEKLNALPEADRNRVEGTLTGLGYLIVPEDLLVQRYNGRSDLAAFYSPQDPPTWFIRFFDYL